MRFSFWLSMAFAATAALAVPAEEAESDETSARIPAFDQALDEIPRVYHDHDPVPADDDADSPDAGSLSDRMWIDCPSNRPKLCGYKCFPANYACCRGSTACSPGWRCCSSGACKAPFFFLGSHACLSKPWARN